MKKTVIRLLALVLAMAMTCGCFAGCDARRNEEGQGGQSADGSKTQLYVGFYYSGLGKEWIQQAAAAFEAKYAETSFEEGKKGVQVRLDLDKAGLNGGSLVETISSKRDQIFFIENSNLYQFVEKDLIKDITHLVQSCADGETVTIEDKLTPSSKEYFGMGGKYYAMPYYESMLGLNYNIDLFDKMNYYFAEGQCADTFDFENGDLNTLFISDASQPKSKGPDNIAGTYDDGLPATYADFRALLMRISSFGDTPLIWCGSYLTYLVEFMNAVWADFEGYDQMMLNWSMDGTATSLVDVAADGTVTPVGDTVITNGENGYMLQKQEGKYRALEFAKICVESSDNYYSDSFSSSLTHIDAQRRFVKGGQGNYENIAMLIDGNWWDVEATAQFDADPASANSKLNMNFGLMPMPKVNQAAVESADNSRTLLTLNNSMVFINANTPDELMPAAETFFKYIHSDEAINIFCQYTNMMRPFNYTLTDETLANMSTYGKEMYRIHQEAKATQEGTAQYPVYIQDCYPTTDAAIKNTDLLNPKIWGWSNVAGQVNPFVTFKENATMTAAEYFQSLFDNYVGSWGAKWAS